MEKLTNKIIEECLINFVKHSTYMVLILDESGKILYSNDALRNCLKVNLENEESDIWQYVNSYSKGLCQDTFSNMASGETESLEIILKDSKGFTFHTEGRFNCLQVAAEFPKMIIGILEDVSERNLLSLDYINLMRQFEDNNVYLQLIYEVYNAMLDNLNISFEQRIENVLEKLGKKVYADRAFIIRYDFNLGVFDKVYEWCEEGIVTKKNGISKTPIDSFETMIKKHINDERVYIEDLGSLSIDDSMRILLETFGVMSTISIPLTKEGICFGCIGFDSVKINRTNAEYETRLLRDVSNILLIAILKNEDDLRLNKIQNKFDKVLLDAPIAMFITDEKRKIIYANKALSTLSGINAVDLNQMLLDEIVYRVEMQNDNLKEVIINTDEEGLIYGYIL